MCHVTWSEIHAQTVSHRGVSKKSDTSITNRKNKVHFSDADYTRRDTPARPSRQLSRSLSCLSTPAGSISKYVKNIYYTLRLSIRLLVAGLHSTNKQSYIHCSLKMELVASLVAGLHSWDLDQLWAQLQLHRWWHDNQHSDWVRLCRGWGTRARGPVVEF